MKRKQVYYNQDTSKLQEQKAYGEFQDLPSAPGGGLTPPPDTPYASNAAAVAALGVGKLYKTTIVGADGIQPVLSITI